MFNLIFTSRRYSLTSSQPSFWTGQTCPGVSGWRRRNLSNARKLLTESSESQIKMTRSLTSGLSRTNEKYTSAMCYLKFKVMLKCKKSYCFRLKVLYYKRSLQLCKRKSLSQLNFTENQNTGCEICQKQINRNFSVMLHCECFCIINMHL